MLPAGAKEGLCCRNQIAHGQLEHRIPETLRVRGGGGRGEVTPQVDPDGVAIYFDSICMVRKSQGCGGAAEAEVSNVLKQKEYTITVDLGVGEGRASALTCDFSIDYVKINADYSS